jgi:hypothetical protein
VAGLSAFQRGEILRLAVDLVLDDDFRPEAAVRLAADLVASGIGGGRATVALASEPSDPARLSRAHVEPLFRDMLDELGLPVPSRRDAGWIRAKWIAEALAAGAVAPARGALELWRLWEDCGEAEELACMLQLHDAWEESVGAERSSIETEMVAYASEVIAASDRRLEGGSG